MRTVQSAASLFLADVENNPQPSPYFDLIAAAKSSGAEYWRIWNLLAFRPKASHYLAAFSHEIMHEDAPISKAMRELIATYTSSLNRCEFCMKAHAAVAAHLFGDEALVWSVVRDLETSPLAEKDKAILRFVHKLTLNSGSIDEADVAILHSVGWDDTSIYYAIAACGLFNFYNRFVSGNGVKPVSDAAFKRLGARMAERGYLRD
ncbi:carboxymuconolactone decarboxylase family protein [Acidicapsa ligni]|uniref:carboxymuconolactone decarboxylase family protein n=1 Tax=Acidicapsa ligni TaxID=542300 RepID=UPI0021DFFD7B|nr:peroxidase-related enzyme [Acidicapsa ligni]